MRTLIDRTILLVAIIGAISFNNLSIYGIVGILLTLSLAGFMYYVNDRKSGALIEGVAVAVYASGAFVTPIVAFGLPVIIYEYLYTKTMGKRFLYICELLRIYSVVILLISLKNITGYSIFIIIVLSMLAAWMAMQTRKVNILEDKLIKTIDTDAEYQLELKRNNRMLLEKQDNEVYMATLKERNRIAREIHDNVGHMLVRGIMQCGAIITINKDEELDEHLKALKDTLDNSMNSIRSSVHDLHDDAIDLKSSLAEIINELDGYKVNFEYDIESSMNRNVKYAIIAIVKEAVTNIIKYCDGNNVQIIVREHPAFYQLIVSDDGTKAKQTEGGIGLNNMRDRVEMLGGTLVINTDNGFKIFVNIPR